MMRRLSQRLSAISLAQEEWRKWHEMPGCLAKASIKHSLGNGVQGLIPS